MTNEPGRVCPVEKAGSLDLKMRRWVQNPRKIVGPYVTQGMTILEPGCGPGFFTLDMAQLVGQSGRVIAADLQEGMLDRLRIKIQGTGLSDRITLHKCDDNAIGISEKIDFGLLFYMVHEVRDKKSLFVEIESLLKPDGQVLMVEPLFHVSRNAFEDTIKTAGAAGLITVTRPAIFFSRSALLRKAGQ